MGTRNLVSVVKGGKFRVAQYGQWDGYPEGVGSSVLKFLKSVNLAYFSEKIENCFFGTNEQIEDAYAKYSTNGMMNMDQAREFKRSKYWYLDRDVGADILDIIMSSSEPIMLCDSHEFAGSGLFCEWAYVIDLDRNVFEIYKGFFKTPVPADQRFSCFNEASETEAKEQRAKNIERMRENGNPSNADKIAKSPLEVYYPVHLVKEYSLKKLPSKKRFLEELTEPEEVD